MAVTMAAYEHFGFCIFSVDLDSSRFSVKGIDVVNDAEEM